MCGTCGCAEADSIKIDGHEMEHNHDHNGHNGHNHDQDHTHSTYSSRTLEIHQGILGKNDRLAERNRGYFLAKGLFVLNIVSSPGAGKTAFLERLGQELKLKLGAIVGDLETDNDAQRLRQAGIPTRQITTGTLCHLEADMLLQAARQLNLDQLEVLAIENVGNLVCPAAYDLGEDLRVVLLSTTEGEDKPLKYPTLFKSADVVIISKIDLAEVVEFKRELAIKNIQQIAPQGKIFEVSGKTGQGMDNFSHYLSHLYEHKVPGLVHHQH